MATLRELKTRIGSVASSEKITGAMKMISSAKVHKFERSLQELLPFKNQIQTIMGHILSAGVDFQSPLIVERTEVKKIGIVVYGSDDGLCGAYNLNICKGLLAEIDHLQEKYGNAVEITVYPVGNKIYHACHRLEEADHIEVKPIEGVNSKMDGTVVNNFTEDLRTAFSTGDLDLVEVVYMRYITMGRQRLTVDQLFPVKADLLLSGDATPDENQLYIFEPDANDIFNAVLPMFVQSTMQEITIENRASEQAARVMAMQSANDNAKKLEEELQIEYNKLRQESITTELLDIVGGQVER